MSKDKHRGRSRRHQLLRDLDQTSGGRLPLNCEGGISMKNRDLRRLVSDGVLRIVRLPVFSWFGPHIRRTYAERVGKKQ